MNVTVRLIDRLRALPAFVEQTVARFRRNRSRLARETDVGHLRTMAAGFAATFNAGDLDGLMRFYGDTYVDVNLRQPVQSFEERRAYFSRVLQRGLRIDVHPDEILIDGAMALVRGRIAVRTVSGEDGPSVSELRYLEVARKGADGSWKAIWGMDGPIQDA